MPRKPFEQHLQDCMEVHEGKYVYPPQPGVPTINYNIVVFCKKHGVFYQKLHIHKKGHGCPKCGVDKRVSLSRKAFQQHLKECVSVHERRYVYPPQPAVPSVHYKIAIYCPKHDCIFYQKLNNHKKGHLCPKCGAEKKVSLIRKSFEQWLKKCQEVHNFNYIYPPQPAIPNVHYKIAIYCLKHDFVFYQELNQHKKGQGCPRCAIGNVSNIEYELKEHIEQKFKTTVIRGYKLKTKDSWLEIDLYLPYFNIGIEINGSYWHSVKQKPRDYHKQKSLLAFEHGIEMLHWHEEDINNNLLTLLNDLESLVYNKHEQPNTECVFQNADNGSGCWLRKYGYLPIYWSDPVLRTDKRFNYWDSGIIVWKKYSRIKGALT